MLAYLGIALLLLGAGSTPVGSCWEAIAYARSRLITLAREQHGSGVGFAMEPDRSTIDRAWIRRHGGRYLTVPLSNFLGCFVAAWRSFRFSRSTLRGIRRLDILNDQNYGDVLSRSTVCAGISFRSMARPVVLDAPEQAWHTQTILLAESAASVFIMGGFATSAWRRSARKNMRAELTHNPEGSTNRLVLGNAHGAWNVSQFSQSPFFHFRYAVD